MAKWVIASITILALLPTQLFAAVELKEQWTSNTRIIDNQDGTYTATFGKTNYFDGKEYNKLENIEKDYEFPEGKETKNNEPVKIAICPEWAKCETSKDGQTAYLKDNKDDILFIYHTPIYGDSITSTEKEVANYEIQNGAIYFVPPKNSKYETAKIFDDYYSNASGDGYIISSNAVYLTARNATTGTADNTITGSNICDNEVAAGTYYVTHGFFPFDTSALPDTAEIIEATFRIFAEGTQRSGDGGYVTLVTSTQASSTNLVGDDFEQIGSLSGANQIAYTAIVNNFWNTFTLTQTSSLWINPTGFSKLALRDSNDISATQPTGIKGLLQGRFSDYAGTATDPYLSITYKYTTYVTTTLYTTCTLMSPENIKIMITCLLILIFLGIADFFRRLFAKRK